MPRPRKTDQLTVNTHAALPNTLVDPVAVETARASLPNGITLERLSRLFAVLGDPTRLRMMAALAAAELCVADLAAAVALSESAVSHQLRLLKNLSLVRSRREGRRVFYTLDDEHVTELYGLAREHVEHQ